MSSAAILKKLLNRQKQNKFGDAVAEGRWADVLEDINAGKTKTEDIFPVVEQQGKMGAFYHFLLTTEPTNQTLTLILKVIPMVPAPIIENTASLYSQMVAIYPKYATLIIETIVRSFIAADVPSFVPLLKDIIQINPSLIGTISSSLSKYFPQTLFAFEVQHRYLTYTLDMARICPEVGFSIIGRVVQHIVALDCEFFIGVDAEEGIQVDSEVAPSYWPQFLLVLDYLDDPNQELFTSLLQAFASYVLDLPRALVVQFLVFWAASFSEVFTEQLIGFFIFKLTDASTPTRSRENSALYLQSLVARASFINDKLALTVADYITDFAKHYVEFLAENGRLNRSVQMHSVFYFAVQALAYIICWRESDFRHMNVDFAERFSLETLFCSSLDAGSIIDRGTSEAFLKLGFVNYKLEAIVIEKIEAWFPFDPCPINEIQERFSEIYRDWGCLNEPQSVSQLIGQELDEIGAVRGIDISSILASFRQ